MTMEMKLTKSILVAALLAGTLTLAACGGGNNDSSTEMSETKSPYETAKDKIAAATTEADAQAAYDEVKDDVTAAEGEKLQDAVDKRVAVLAKASREKNQKNALMTAAGKVDTTVEATEEAIAAAKVAINDLQAALNAAVDVIAADKTKYQGQLDDANKAVETAQENLDTKGRANSQRMAINEAITKARTAVGVVNNNATDAQVLDAENALSALEMAIDNAADVPEDDPVVANGEGTHVTLTGVLSNAKKLRSTHLDGEKERADKARNDMAKKLHAGLGTGSVTLDNASIAISPTGAVTGTTPAVTFKKTDTTVVSYGDWSGNDYLATAGTTTDHAVVYTNQDSGEQVPFADKWGDATDGVANILDSNGNILQENLNAARAKYVDGADFASGSGGKNHTKNENDNVSIAGTFDGASGTYTCDQSSTTRCRSQVDGDGGIILTGGWSFMPANGVMVQTRLSGNYVAYGWWSRETSDDVDVFAFQQDIGTDANVTSTTTVTGTATYSGGAAGKYAIYNPLDADDSDAGAFTAAAKLTAEFGKNDVEGTVSGELTNFMADGTSKDWTVTLKGSGDSDGAALASGVISGGETVWSIGGTEADAGGSWSGNFYNAADAANVGDAPANAAGVFTSNYGDGVGRMSGAFGASLDN